MKFNELKLEKNILKALKEAGYSEPTPIQQQAIPPVLEGRDLMGCAQTGTGKTCAFAVPIIQRLAKSEGKKGTIRALILTPTRELALQIYENVCQYARYVPCSAAVIFGGVSQVPQVEAIERGVDILIATPGRLWDLMGQKIVKLDKAEFFVLDEADRMLDMGFFPDVKRIVKFLPKKRQTLLFSATIPAEIADLAEKMLHEPEHISVTPSAKPADKIEQQLYFVEKQEKRELLPDIIRQSNVHQVLVFTRTKHGADRVARDLNRAGIKTKSILFVGTKKQAQDAIKEEAERCGQFYVNARWLGGMLTNFKTMRTRIARLNQLQKMQADGTFDLLPKKEVIKLQLEIAKLEKYLGGVKEMKELPGALFVVDSRKEKNAIAEARKLGIPIVAIVDTNCDPDEVDYVIPGNDDAIRAIKLISQTMANAVLEGKQGEQLEVEAKADAKAE